MIIYNLESKKMVSLPHNGQKQLIKPKLIQKNAKKPSLGDGFIIHGASSQQGAL